MHDLPHLAKNPEFFGRIFTHGKKFQYNCEFCTHLTNHHTFVFNQVGCTHKRPKAKKNIEAGSRCFYFFCQCNAWLFPKGLSSPTFPRNDKDSLFWDCTGDALGAYLREIWYLLKKTTFAIIYYSQLSLWSQQLFIARWRCGASYNRWSWTDVGEGKRGAADWSRVAFLSRSHFCSLWLQLRSYCCCCCN